MRIFTAIFVQVYMRLHYVHVISYSMLILFLLFRHSVAGKVQACILLDLRNKIALLKMNLV